MGTLDGPARILVADDDQTLLKTLVYILKGEGHEVTTLDSGEKLLDEMHRHPPDLLLLDIMMPKVDGLQLLERIRTEERWQDLPILMISSMPPEDTTVRALGLGADDFIPKPFRVRELLARVDARLRKARVLQQTRVMVREHAEHAEQQAHEARVRAEMADILHEITDSLKTDEIYHILARRVARVLKLSKCSMVLAKPGDEIGLVVAAFENPNLRNLEIQLEKYPEIQKALSSGQPVLVEDVQTDPLYAEVRDVWKRDGITVATRSVIALPFGLKDEQRGVFFLRTTEADEPLTSNDVTFAGAVINAAVAALGKAYDFESAISERERYQELARTDALTGMLNRRALFERLDREMERVRRYEHGLTLLLLDLDNFKEVNDTRGHLAGDGVLRQLATVFQREARSVDLIGRYGGDEFVIVLPDTAMEGAVVFAERLRERVQATDFAEDGDPLYVTASVGVATFPQEEIANAQDLIAEADRAMYRAKDEGRNQVRQ